jgi:3-deoxy-D-manno-octulosonic-acid transferase
MAARPLVHRLQQAFPGHQMLITCTTPTGSDRVRSTFGDGVLHTYLPYDVPFLVHRFLKTVRPEVAIFMETEIWPNYLRICASKGIPTVVANARLSERSARGYARLGGLIRPALDSLSLVLASARRDARRFRALGARPERVLVCGNIKFDVTVPKAQVEEGRRLRNQLFLSRPVLCIASTHAGEDELLVDWLSGLRQVCPELAVVWVPRHPERFDEVARMLEQQGWPLTRRSDVNRRPDGHPDILLGDSMGEMFMYFAMADMAFMGGSLKPIGGHNPMEPAALGLPIMCGPHTFNFAEVTEALLRAGGLVRAGLPELRETCLEWLGDPDRRAAVGGAARAWVEGNRGAADRMLDAIRPLLEGEPGTAASERQ